MIWLLALLWAMPTEADRLPAADPRIEWVELQRAGRLDEALERVEAHLEDNGSPEPGALYLRGRLLGQLGRHGLAAGALAEALSGDPAFKPWSRFRLAETQVEQGHPEVASGLLATLLGDRPDEALRSAAARQLAATIDQGGDCRLLTHLETWRLDSAERRPLQLARAACTREADPTAADDQLIALLAEDTSDGTALSAAERLATSQAEPAAAVALDMAMAFFGQRDFERALEFFARGLAPDAAPLEVRRDYDTQYAVARSYFWLGRYAEAGARYATLAADATRPELAAKAHYQQARCLELAQDRRSAEQAYARALAADPTGSWSGAAQGARLRLLWLLSDEAGALELYAQLGRHRRWQGSRARSALFLAASDLVQGRTSRADAWLATAAAARDSHAPEVAYWQGRLAEALGDPTEAVAAYQRALVADPWDPWAGEARSRLGSEQLAVAARAATTALLASTRGDDLIAAWLLADNPATRNSVRARLVARLNGRQSERAFIELAAVPTPAWPLWTASPSSPTERLLALGDWQFGREHAPEHFPYTEERLGLTRARALAEAGLTRASIRSAEILASRSPDAVHEVLWPAELARTLYPLAHGGLIRHRTLEVGLDPLLLAAVIREESRFDARATSAAAARGLTQFVLPTARRLAQELGLSDLVASDLYKPEVAIRLGSAYLSELAAMFESTPHMMLAAYNAGENQAALWHTYCLSDEPAEYLTKVGFRETRGYLRKVLRSRARYRELYPAFSPEVSPRVDSGPGISASTSSK